MTSVCMATYNGARTFFVTADGTCIMLKKFSPIFCPFHAISERNSTLFAIHIVNSNQLAVFRIFFYII